MPHVIIFGAGIAGLASAHELIHRGYQVSVYESNEEPGGFARSTRHVNDNGMPSEYSYRGFGPWYHNAFHFMKQVPGPVPGKSIYDSELSRPIAFPILKDNEPAEDTSLFSLNLSDKLALGLGLARSWAACPQRDQDYAQLNASDYLKPRMTDRGWKIAISVFGPWIGISPDRTSCFHAGSFFRKNLLSNHSGHVHPSDENGPEWIHKNRSGWLVFRRPSSESWFLPWTNYLTTKGVKFFYNSDLYQLIEENNQISYALIKAHDQTALVKVKGDIYILAITPFSVQEILTRSIGCCFRKDQELKKIKHLIAAGPHVQVSFRLGYSERIKWPIKRGAMIFSDSEYNITLYSQDDLWKEEVSLGENIQTLISGTACVSYKPGRVFHLPLSHCTKEQFIKEIISQIYGCTTFAQMIMDSNDGKALSSFSLIKTEVWHTWKFRTENNVETISAKHPKFVNSTHSRLYEPNNQTDICNLILAGAHTKTSADLWSMEAAAESGRRAALVLLGYNIPQINQIVGIQCGPGWLRILQGLDHLVYQCNGPNIVNVLLFLLFFLCLFLVTRLLKGFFSK